MKHCLYILRIGILVLLACYSTRAQAQLYPVQITVQGIPPYPVYLNQFTQGSTDRLRVQLLLTDINVSNRSVKLKMSITGAGVAATNTAFVRGALPITLSGGQPEYLGNADLAPYFALENLTGIAPQMYAQPLPEGSYTLCFDAFDMISGELLSRKTCFVFNLIQNDPPMLSLPRQNESIPFAEPQNIMFQWTPRHFNATNVQYEFSLVELLDPGMNPQAAVQVLQPYYTTITPSTTLWLGPAAVPLTAGKKYAWRVRAFSQVGLEELGTFKNNGYSEAGTFIYTEANCAAPLGLIATDISKRSLKVSWMPEVATVFGQSVHYKVSYKRRNGSERWYDQQTSENELRLTDLEPGTAYEIRVGRTCGIGGSYLFSNSIYANTASENDTNVQAYCGIPPAPIDVSNQTPLELLLPGETFTAGDFKVFLLEVSGASGRFSGEGYIEVPYLAGSKVRVQFDGIYVNNERKLVQGFVETAYDPNMSGILNLDDLFEGGAGQGSVKTGNIALTYQTNFTITSAEDIQVNIGANDYGSIQIANNSNGGGSGMNISISPNNKGGLPLSIGDNQGNVFAVTRGEDGQTRVVQVASPIELRMPAAALDKLATGIGRATFANAQGSRYVIDNWRSDYNKSVLWLKEYQKLTNDYYVGSKFTIEGQPEPIAATVQLSNASFDADSVLFITATGLRYESQHQGSGQYSLTVVGSPSADAQELYAVYPTADTGVYLPLGKLLLAGYASKTAQVTLVPTNGATVDTAIVFASLRSTYDSVGIQLALSLDAPWSNTTWDADANGVLQLSGTNGWSVYTEEMKALNGAYKAERNLAAQAAYLFVLPSNSAEGNAMGDMPRGKRFGYLFSGNDGKLAAHEVGHGVFHLKHVFDKSIGFSEQQLPDNLMSYGSGHNLSKSQWDALHSPGLVIGAFEEEEDGMINTISTFIEIDKDRIFISPAGNPIYLPAQSRIYYACFQPSQFPTFSLLAFRVFNVESQSWDFISVRQSFWTTTNHYFTGYVNQHTSKVWAPQNIVKANEATTITLLHYDEIENTLSLYEKFNYQFQPQLLSIENGVEISTLPPGHFKFTGTAIQKTTLTHRCSYDEDRPTSEASPQPIATINTATTEAVVTMENGRWKVDVKFKSDGKGGVRGGQGKAEIEQEMSEIVTEILNDLGSMDSSQKTPERRYTTSGDDEFWVRSMNFVEWVETVSDLGTCVWDSAKIPSAYWNRDNGYATSNIHMPPMFAGVGDGVVEEVTALPQLVRLGYDVVTKDEVREGLWNSVKNISVESLIEGSISFYEQKKANYTSDKPYITQYAISKDVVELTSTLMGANFFKKGKDALKKGVEESAENVSSKGFKKIEKILAKVDTYEQARNQALEIVGDLGAESIPLIGRLKSSKSFEKISGRMSADNKKLWRVDYDPDKGMHINIEDYSGGKGMKAKKYVIPFNGDEKTFENILNTLNK